MRLPPTVPAGAFITFEGGEGVGKSTQVRRLARALRSQGQEVVETFEPGATSLGRSLRRLLLESGEVSIDPLAESLLLVADRRQHLQQVIRPARARGAVVICDRFLDSTLAYQGYGRGLDLQDIIHLHRAAGAWEPPDLTLVLDLDERAGLGRLASRKGGLDRLEAEAGGFHARVRQGYLALAAEEPGRFRVLDAGGAVEAVEERVMLLLAGRWPEVRK